MDDVAEAIEQIKPFVGDSGTCDDTLAIEYLNKAQLLLYNKTDAPSICSWWCFRCVRDCITLPNWVQKVILAFINGNPTSLGNEWYTSTPGIGQNHWNHSFANRMSKVGGNFVTFQNYELDQYQIAFQSESNMDIGVELTPTGIDKYETLQSETIALAQPPNYAFSTKLYKAVTAMVKPVTHGRVRMYAYNPNNRTRLLIAIYQPEDINPSFIRFQIPCRCPSNCLTIYAKKKYRPVTKLTDFVDFSIDALIHATQAITLRLNKGNEAGFTTELALAIAEVNRTIADNEMDTGSPLRVFAPQIVDNLNPSGIGGYGWAESGSGWGANGFY